MGGPGNRIGQPLLGPGAGAPSAGGGSMDTTSPRVSFAPAPDTAVRVHPRRTSLNTDSTEAATDKQYGFAVTPRTPSQSTRLIFWLLGAYRRCGKTRNCRGMQPCRNSCGTVSWTCAPQPPTPLPHAALVRLTAVLWDPTTRCVQAWARCCHGMPR